MYEHFSSILRKQCKQSLILIWRFWGEVQDRVTLLEAKVLLKCSESRVFVDLCKSPVENENFSPNIIYLESHSLEALINDVAGCCYGKVFGNMKSVESYNSQTTSVVHVH